MEINLPMIPLVPLLLLSVLMVAGLVFGLLVIFLRKPNENMENQHRADKAMWYGLATFLPATPVALLEAYFIRNYVIRVSMLCIGVVLAIVLLYQNAKMIYYRLHR